MAFFDSGGENKCILHAVNNAYGEKIIKWDDATWMQTHFEDPVTDDAQILYNRKLRVAESRASHKIYGYPEIVKVFNSIKGRRQNLIWVSGRTNVLKYPQLLDVALRNSITALIGGFSVSGFGCGHSIAIKDEGQWMVYDDRLLEPIPFRRYKSMLNTFKPLTIHLVLSRRTAVDPTITLLKGDEGIVDLSNLFVLRL